MECFRPATYLLYFVRGTNAVSHEMGFHGPILYGKVIR